MRVVIGVDGLSFQASYGIKLLDGGRSQACERTEYSTFDFCHLCILHGIYEGILCLCRMVLQLFGGVFFAEWCDFVEIHFQIVRHLLGQVVFRRSPLLVCICQRLLQESRSVLVHLGGGSDLRSCPRPHPGHLLQKGCLLLVRLWLRQDLGQEAKGRHALVDRLAMSLRFLN